MADMNEIYDALRKANASGDTASVAKLSDYINSKPIMAQSSPAEETPLTADAVKKYYADPKNRRDPIQDVSALTYGAETGIIGFPGVLESLGRSGLRALGADVSEKTVLPTPTDVRSFATKHVGFPSMEGDPRIAAGEIIPAVGPTAALAAKIIPSAARVAGRVISAPYTLAKTAIGSNTKNLSNAIISQMTDAEKANLAAQQSEAARRALISSGRAKVLAQRNAVPADITTVGASATASDIGDILRNAANKNLSTAEKQSKDLFDAKNALVKQAQGANEAINIGVSDIPEAQSLVAKSKAILTPDPMARGIVTRLSDGEKAFYQDIIDTFSPKKVEISADAAKAAQARGEIVTSDTTTLPYSQKQQISYYRMEKPDLTTVDNFRRKVGDVHSTALSGSKAILGNQKKGIYDILNDIEDAYVGGLHGERQDAWSTLKKLQESFAGGPGKNLTETNKTGEFYTSTASQLPATMFNKGRDAVKDMVSKSGLQATQDAASKYTARLLNGKSVAEAQKTLESDYLVAPELANVRKSVENYIKKMRNGENVTSFEQSAAEDKANFAKYKPASGATESQAQREYNAWEATTKGMDKEALLKPDGAARKYFDDLYKNNKISSSKWNEIKEQIETARHTAKNTTQARQILTGIGVLAAGSVVAPKIVRTGMSFIQ
jgi:hypothetical protein